MLEEIKQKLTNFSPNFSWRKVDFCALGLFVIVSILSFANYVPGTWLSGWDTLHPEFNFGLYLKRAFFSVWQEHQGLGAVASQSHAAELPRLLLLYPLSLVLPDSFLRYGYFFLTLFAGTLGAYYFFKNILFKNVEESFKKAVSFSGALIYLLNLATLQQFYVPLEMFATHFATFPWILLITTKYIESGRWKNLVWVLLAAIFVAPIAQTATLFYVFFGLMLVYWILISGFKKSFLKRVGIVVLAFLALNAYWLLPNIYYVLNHASDVSASKIHTQFTDKAFYTGKKFGDVLNTGFLKNFLFDWGEYDENSGRFVDLFDEWQPHLSGFIPFITGYLIFIMVIFGAIKSTLVKSDQRKYATALLPIGVICFLFIANNNLLSDLLYSFFEKYLPSLKEALRFPFTKFSIILAFCYASFASIAIHFTICFLVKYVKRGAGKIPYFIAGIITLLLVFYMLPAFQGNLISKSMRVKIPQEYFRIFNWFSGQDKNARIATFPIDTFWGWEYYSWGYEGAGFRWFGIEQPLLDREFDRWYPYNEKFYWEASQAVYSKNQQLFEKVLDKYQVSFVYLDESIISPWSPKSLYFDELKTLLSNSEKFEHVKQEGKISVYKVNLKTPSSNNLSIINNLISAGPGYKWNNYDKVYFDNGNYKSGDNNDIYYPFRSLFTGKEQKDLEFNLEDQGDSLVLKANLPEGVNNWKLQLPVAQPELYYIDKNDMRNVKTFVPEVNFKENILTIKFPKIEGYYSAQIDPALDKETKFAKNCNNKPGGLVKNQIILDGENKVKRLIAEGATNCSTAFWFDQLPHDLSYLVSVNSRNVKNKSLLFWVENLSARKSEQETYLPQENTWQKSYFIIPPLEKDASGYALHFDNTSFGSERVVNDLGKISLQSFPYKYLTSIYLQPADVKLLSQEVSTPETSHPSPDLYILTLSQPGSGTIVLSQAYSDGWKAYKGHFGYLSPLFGSEIKEHVKVNNWENGWNLPADTTKVTILFLPQYLQFFGYFLALGSIIALFIPRIRRRIS